MTLNTRRLSLRSGRAEDAGPLFEGYFGSGEASRFLGRRPHAAIDDTRAFIDRWCGEDWGASGAFAWIVAAAPSGYPIGMVLVIARQHMAEIHYGIAPAASSKGYATEAVVAATDWMLAQGLQRVWTAVDVEHLASRRVLDKAGYMREGVLRNWAVLPAFGSQARDAVAYSRVG